VTDSSKTKAPEKKGLKEEIGEGDKARKIRGRRGEEAQGSRGRIKRSEGKSLLQGEKQGGGKCSIRQKRGGKKRTQG